jgi:putative peptide zinc metalloprotease protein
VLLECRNELLDAQITEANAELAKAEAKIRHGNASDPALAGIYESRRKEVGERLKTLTERKNRLTVRAPIDGELVAPHMRDLDGKFLPKNQELALVQRREKLTARVLLKQEDVEPVIKQSLEASADPDAPRRVEVRMVGDVATFLGVESVKKVPAAQDYLPHAAMGQSGGGEIAIDPQDPSGAKPTQRQFEVAVTLVNPDNRYAPGQQAYVRFKLDKKPLIWQWGRRFWQLIQTNSMGNNA